MRSTLTKFFLIVVFLGIGPDGFAGLAFERPMKSIKIPVEIINNIIIAQVSINNSVKLNFIVDTGVRTTILTEPYLAPFLNLGEPSEIRVRGLGEGTSIPANLYRNVSLRMRGVVGRGSRLIVLPSGMVNYSEMFGMPIHGIIGHELFAHFTVEVNYVRKVMRLYDPFKYKVKNDWEEIEIDLKRGKPYIKANYINPEGEKEEADWLLDMGASQALALFDQDVTLPDKTLDAFLGKGLSGNVYGKLGRITTFEIGNHQFEEVITGFPEPESLNMIEDDQYQWYGNIGSEILSRFHITFDYLHRRILIKRNHMFKRKFQYNMSGIEVLSKGEAYDIFEVTYVRPNSPADKVGVKPSDIILSVNGQPLDKATIGDMYVTLAGRDGRRITLRLKRGKAILKKRFFVSSEI